MKQGTTKPIYQFPFQAIDHSSYVEQLFQAKRGLDEFPVSSG